MSNLNADQFGDYRGGHRPADPDDGVGAPFHQADQVMPDVTGPRGHRLYGHGETGADESIAQIRAAKGNPDHEVKIYRAVPKVEHGINPGDWITPSRQYAQQHAMQDDDPAHDWPVVEGRAKASEIWGHGDSPNEWGYHPR